MGSKIDYEEMSDVYRRIKKRRAKERYRRKRRARRMKSIMMLAFVLVVGIGSILFVLGLFRKDKNGLEEEMTTEHASVIENAILERTEIRPVVAEAKTREYPKVDGDFISITTSDIVSPYQALYSVEDNRLIAGRSATSRIYPASMTKVMTLIVAVEHLKDLEDTFQMTSEIIDPLVREEASRAGFESGENVRVEDLFYGLILPSGADAAAGLAILSAGSEEAFVDLMNEKCEELGLKNTHFTNPSGLHNSNQYTTPLEMAVIMAYAMEDETCARILSTYQYTTKPNEFHPEGILLTSTMFSRMYGDEVEGMTILAGKTGYTMEAGNCLVSYARKGEQNYVAVSAGAGGKWNVIFDAFELYKRYVK